MQRIFCPLNQASLINLSLKRVFFLLSMAMARCVSEILAFLTTSDSVHSDGSLTIRTE